MPSRKLLPLRTTRSIFQMYQPHYRWMPVYMYLKRRWEREGSVAAGQLTSRYIPYFRELAPRRLASSDP